MRHRETIEVSPEQARDIAVIEAHAPQRGKNRATRQRMLNGFRAMPARQPSPCFREPKTGIIDKNIRNRAARKKVFLFWTSRATTLTRFNAKQRKAGLPEMDHVPLGNPGGWAVTPE